NGTSYVAHGGNAPIINYHQKSRAQRYALDIGEINRFGYEPAFSKNLHSYLIFGRPIYSPCDGTVKEAVKDLPDQTPPKTDKHNISGNHVIVQCKGIAIMLAHMKQNSVQVEANQRVTTRTKLGEVGNSGNTTQPHLHIHAVPEKEEPLKGNGVPLLINGKFLVRNDVLK
ncbi:MAG TPA: M23 family metallopeptidase, partial [Candidatus Polarisedimenticolaceae bacterium]|nr:M23 family metallopeptidase [Candidatus Polarisedimenticolaceae bacterium]